MASTQFKQSDAACCSRSAAGSQLFELRGALVRARIAFPRWLLVPTNALCSMLPLSLFGDGIINQVPPGYTGTYNSLACPVPRQPTWPALCLNKLLFLLLVAQ